MANYIVKGVAHDMERLHEIAVRKHGCLLTRKGSSFQAVVPLVTPLQSLLSDLLSIRGVEVRI